MATTKKDKKKDPVAEKVGKNLAAMRGSTTQKELANEMQKRGYNWVPATVWAAEAGERKIKIDEAKVLSEILEGSLDDFFSDPEETEYLNKLRESHSQVWDDFKSLEQHLSLYFVSRAHLVSLLKVNEAHLKLGRISGDVVALLGMVEQTLEASLLVNAVRRAYESHPHTHDVIKSFEESTGMKIIGNGATEEG